MTQLGISLLGLCHQTERCGKPSQVGQAPWVLREPSLAIDEPGLHAHCVRACEVVVGVVADHHRCVRRDRELLEHRAEDRLVRLRLAVDPRGQDRVDVDGVVRDEDVEVATARALLIPQVG